MTENELMQYSAVAECEAKPEAVLVHNPIAVGAFRLIDSISDDARLEEEVLFRHRPNRALYAFQHDAFVATIARHVPHVLHLSEVIPEEPAFQLCVENPNQVFTRDSVITLPWLPGGYFRSRLNPSLRRIESETTSAALARLGLREFARLPDSIFLEGGDVIPFAYGDRRCLLVGYGPRSTPSAIDYLQQEFLPRWADEIIAIHLAPWRMNLDGGFVPVAEDVVVSNMASVCRADLVTENSRTQIDLWKLLGDLKIRVIDTTQEESIYAQSCNCLCLGDRRVVYYDLCPRVAALLEQHDVTVLRVPGSELVKGRGGPRCMSRPIYQKLAAGVLSAPTFSPSLARAA